MVAEASNEHGDSFIIVDVRDGYPCFREATDVVAQRFIWIVSNFLQIILVARMLTSGHVIVDESPPKLSLGVTPQVFSSIIALHYMSISMHHFMLCHMVATNVICF
jgi:hypothetical protein